MNRLKDTRTKGKRPSKRSSKCVGLVNKRWKADCSEQRASEIVTPVTSYTSTNEPVASASTTTEKKLSASNFQIMIDPDRPPVDFYLVHNSVWEELYTGMLCTYCGKQNLCANTVDSLGFAFKIVVKCNNCNSLIKEILSSPRVAHHETTRAPFEVNRRMVDTFLDIGKGFASMQKYCMGMGMTCMSSTAYSKHISKLASDNSNLVSTEVLRKAHTIIREAHIESDPSLEKDQPIDIAVSYDGTWMRRGHSSLYGIGIVIDIMTGLVVDYEILSKYCSLCSQNEKKMSCEQYAVWYEGHKTSGDCESNFDGSSNAMEAAAAEILWKRSIDFANFRYTTMLSDGDAKTFSHLQNLKVYGNEVNIQKEECINHIAKRLGKGLLSVVNEWKKKNVTLGGKKHGSLTESAIARLQIYYRSAITKNIPDVDAMKKAIFATLRHCGSTDSNPQHITCPDGPDSWCFYNKAIAMGEEVPKHDNTSMKTYLRPDVITKIIPLYKRLASDELLRRCTRGKTQNANESLHSVIWRKCPKEIFVSKKRLHVAVTSAISEFNFGCSASLKLQSEVKGTTLSPASLKLSHARDQQRLRQAAISGKKSARTSRRKAKLKKSAAEQRKKTMEGPSYEPGGF